MTGITAEIPVIRAGFRPETPVVDRDFGRKPRWSTGFWAETPAPSRSSGPNFRRKVRSGGVETTVARAARRPKVRTESPAAATESSVRKCGTDHYRNPDHSVGRSFLFFFFFLIRENPASRGTETSADHYE
jgi:hypothetical protein